MTRKTYEVVIVDRWNKKYEVTRMTLAQYHYKKWCNRHPIISGLLFAFTFESPYWLYFRMKYRK